MVYKDCDEMCGRACPDYSSCPEMTDPPPSSEGSTFYVYVANRLSGNPGEYLANVREMSAACRCLMDMGFCPINPAGDILEGLVSPEPLPVTAFQRRSMGLLRLLAHALGTSDRVALFVVHDGHRNGRRSEGVHAEICEAKRLGIPVAFSIEELCAGRGSEP